MHEAHEERRNIARRRRGSALLLAWICLLGAAPAASANVATLIQTIDTSVYSPPSPDPMGITYVDAWDRLLMSDSEVSEIPALFTGENLFEIDHVSGALIQTSSTISFSNEPTGVAYDPATGFFFFSDDNRREVFVVDPGLDGAPGTADDVVSSFDTLAFGSGDPEGVTFDSDQGHLFIADGESNEVYHVDPGPNGLFDGVPPAGDDLVTSFDTAIFGAFDPEGITYDWVNGFLYLSADDGITLYHLTPSGGLVRTIDYSAAGADKPSGLAFGPSSYNPAVFSVYVADRAVDNNEDPNENDGRIYELWVPPITPGNTPPQVDAGPDLSHALPGDLGLDGTVSDDGLPGPGLAIQWIHVSGPGTVGFVPPNTPDTTATFSTAGTYVLRLHAEDGELSARDDVTVVVTGGQGETIVDLAVAASSDDAEQEASGNVKINSGDLEFGTEEGLGQTVGMRFAGVGINRGSTVLNAYVQLQVDEVGLDPTSVVFEGEAVDDAVTFLDMSSNMTPRPRTAAQVAWNPALWPMVGEAGPDQRTPNLAPILQEIIERPGWSAGNALAIFGVGSTGRRAAESVDGGVAPVLHIEVIENLSPVVAIGAPADGIGVFEDTSVAFSATAGDPEEGDLTSQIAWSSDLDGPIGSGAGFSLATLSIGIHTISASASDSAGVVGLDQISVTVMSNTSPLVQLTSPADGTTVYAGAWLAFSASATDGEEGDLSDDLSWSSDLDGFIGTGASFSRANLTPGTHTITAQVQDGGGLIGSDQLSVTILPNTPPVVNIFQPLDGSTKTEGTATFFSAAADDAEEGDLASSLSWVSDRDGPFGTGQSFFHSSLSAGTHVVTASVSDAGNMVGADQVAITVGPNGSPQVDIAQPAGGSFALLGDMVDFSGSAMDPEEGDLSQDLQWSSDLDGSIGSGASFSMSSLSEGTHTITASASDTQGLIGQEQIALQVMDPTPVPTLPRAGLWILGAGLLAAARGRLPGRR